MKGTKGSLTRDAGLHGATPCGVSKTRRGARTDTTKLPHGSDIRHPTGPLRCRDHGEVADDAVVASRATWFLSPKTGVAIWTFAFAPFLDPVGLRPFRCPTSVAILLGEPRRWGLPILGNVALLRRRLLFAGVAPEWCREDGAKTIRSGMARQLLPRGRRRNRRRDPRRPRRGRVRAKRPERLGVGKRVPELEPWEPLEREPIRALELGRVVRRRVEGLRGR